MKLFGIPLYVSYEVVSLFITDNFPTLVLTDDTIFITFILANFMYLFAVYLFCKLCKFVIITFKNFIF